MNHNDAWMLLLHAYRASLQLHTTYHVGKRWKAKEEGKKGKDEGCCLSEERVEPAARLQTSHCSFTRAARHICTVVYVT